MAKLQWYEQSNCVDQINPEIQPFIKKGFEHKKAG
jgi:hypothetical protein